MKKFIISSKIFEDKYGNISTIYDVDTLKMLSNLKISITPINITYKINKNLLKNADGFFLLGGGNINKIKKNKINEIRDEFEKKVFKYFLKTNKPIIAICRGFQNIVNFYGVKLFKIKNHVRKNHYLKINKSRFIKCKKLKVNSYHNYAIKNLPKNFSAVSKLSDGTIEIAEHKKKKILCFMFHPERKMPSQKQVIHILQDFIK